MTNRVIYKFRRKISGIMTTFWGLLYCSIMQTSSPGLAYHASNCPPRRGLLSFGATKLYTLNPLLIYRLYLFISHTYLSHISTNPAFSPCLLDILPQIKPVPTMSKIPTFITFHSSNFEIKVLEVWQFRKSHV